LRTGLETSVSHTAEVKALIFGVQFT